MEFLIYTSSIFIDVREGVELFQPFLVVSWVLYNITEQFIVQCRFITLVYDDMVGYFK